MKRLTRMLAATVDGHAVMVMEAEGEAPVAYDLGTHEEAREGMAKSIPVVQELLDLALPGGHRVQEVGLTWTRSAEAV